jgi:hemolysin III
MTNAVIAKPASERPYTTGEEIANSVTHGLGLSASVVGLIAMLAWTVQHGSVWHIVSCTVYGLALIFMYFTSTVYHGLRNPNAKRKMRVLDHTAIFLLIAGTYTPFMLVNLHGTWGWTVLGLVWAFTIAGIVFKIFFTGRFKLLSSAIYLAQGWLIVIAVKPMLEHIPTVGLLWLLAGGLSYSVGVIFYVWKKQPYSHAIWHLFVLGGSVCHYVAVWVAVLPQQV